MSIPKREPTVTSVTDPIAVEVSDPACVEISISSDYKTVWVNVDGICRLRASRIRLLNLDRLLQDRRYVPQSALLVEENVPIVFCHAVGSQHKICVTCASVGNTCLSKPKEQNSENPA